ncbi:MAG TPA: AsmA-like C-terminal region-containing protein, partial [Bacteroidales bacterium]|nr:AsmA-like C-terminal region-containing protein [Bacteroidales bacterium]
DMTFALKTPLRDPDFKGSMVGRIDLSALSKALPMDSISLSGIIDMSVQMAGRMSMIEKGQYDDFKASGNMSVQNMLVAMAGYPEIKIIKAGFDFTPAWAALTNTNMTIGGKSDFSLSGRLANYIPYLLKDQIIRGNLSMRSKLIDASEIMSKIKSDTTLADDTTALAVIQVPENIDFDFDAIIDEFRYDNLKGQNVKGHIIIRDGILSIKQTEMNILNGTIRMNADYDTRDTLKPAMKADFDVQNIAVKDAFNTFNTVKKLAPAAKGLDGKISAKLAFSSLLGRDMMPVTSSISGEGKLKSDEITLLESETYNKMKELLKLGDKYNNTFRDINISFKINDGRIFVSPFDVKTGNLKMNIRGDQGIDQTLNYFVKTEMPRSDLGSSVNALIDNLSKQAAAFGISYKPSDIIKVNLKVTGTFTRPEISPVFGNSSGETSQGAKAAASEAVKQTIDNAVESGKEKARAEAEVQAANLVKEAEEKGQLMRDEAAKAAETIRKEADVQAKKLIEDNAKKSTIEQMGAKQGADALRKNADKKAAQLVKEADVQANKLVDEARKQGDELIKKI